MAAALRFTYLPIIPSPSPTPTFTILTHTSIVLTADRVPSMTTVVGLGPRAVSYTTVYVTPTTSTTLAPEVPEHRDPVYGDLTWSYVVLLCVPFVVLAVALYSNYRDRHRRVFDQDIEMQSFQKFWFPWRELDPGEVPNEVSRPAAAAAAQGLSRKERRYAWHPSDDDPMPPVTIYSDPPSWGRRHSWWEVAAYHPACPTPLTSQRRRQAAVADYSDKQIYGRTGSRRNADPEELAKDGDETASDNDSVTATTGRASPNIGPWSSSVRGGGNAESASPNPWAAHIPSYYGNLPLPVSPVSKRSPSQGTGAAGAGSSNAGEAQVPAGISTTVQRRADRSRSRFDLSSEDEAGGQPAEPQHSYYADPSTRAGKQPVKP
ncbi:hypothetical protein CGRA01v4_03841 [Colletotrichum graminicola]|uniref:Uncharacterized protein n=1 Tax=Colletotrichum graminicola (strain M1.001 / M2 / FGSC 10212) TaxID=645133 RepID=E3QG91_COLGM|nr:uncharacterized protein GLRG_04831 [Colletotrichum graminicola M1.001]EFQ29687.1 hypothetical protein GLRG_04831 [Colletotrichum graminicola M1.001]WDK12561.1 hypothetical protein CGRA01v4_03841 [Colletotrichum graminicola]